MSCLNPLARCFVPVKDGICQAFQFGECGHGDHHRDRNSGKMFLHVCQPCALLRGDFLDHTCSGRHPNSNQHCGQKHYGAIACPHQNVDLSLQSQQVNTVENRQMESGEKTHIGSDHTPSLNCPCNQCAGFFDILQDELDHVGANIGIVSIWDKINIPKMKINNSQHNSLDMCEDCEYKVAEPFSTLCDICEAYKKLDDDNLCYDCHFFPQETSTHLCGQCEAYARLDEEDEAY